MEVTAGGGGAVAYGAEAIAGPVADKYAPATPTDVWHEIPLEVVMGSNYSGRLGSAEAREN